RRFILLYENCNTESGGFRCTQSSSPSIPFPRETSDYCETQCLLFSSDGLKINKCDMPIEFGGSSTAPEMMREMFRLIRIEAVQIGAFVNEVTMEDDTTIDLIGTGNTPLHMLPAVKMHNVVIKLVPKTVVMGSVRETGHLDVRGSCSGNVVEDESAFASVDNQLPCSIVGIVNEGQTVASNSRDVSLVDRQTGFVDSRDLPFTADVVCDAHVGGGPVRIVSHRQIGSVDSRDLSLIADVVRDVDVGSHSYGSSQNCCTDESVTPRFLGIWIGSWVGIWIGSRVSIWIGSRVGVSRHFTRIKVLSYTTQLHLEKIGVKL
nr:hypothetical protein [Tanacetum cinerariifolium]